MAVRSQQHETWGVQFHPESILTECGMQLLANFLELCR
jgi:anthranilate/para-aminobenzoate synthase component II